MKNQKNNLIFFALTLGCGAAAGIFRMRLLGNGLDEKGLLVPGNPLNYAIWAVVIGYLAVMLVLARGLGANGTFAEAVPACKLRAGLGAAGGVLLIAESVRVVGTQKVAGILGLLAGACMVVTGALRWSGKRPSPLFHCVVCLFFTIRLILGFQSWGADPQLQDYALQLLACVGLMLFAFHRTSCDAEIISRKRTVFFGLAAVFFCVASLSDETAPLFYAASGLWAIGAGCSLENLPGETAEEA